MSDSIPRCPGCGFSISDLDRRLRQVPVHCGFVNDLGGLLLPEQRLSLENRLSQFHEDHSGEIVLVTVTSTQPIKPSEFAFWLFNRWQVGGKTHAGLMVLLAMQERRIECEVGYAWEPIISDVESGEVLDKLVLPLLKEGRVYEALRASIEQLVRTLEQAPLSQ
ncbi:MAG TPA: TPM domain-containing protein [Gammaproteobacteria bacterium]|nr:TPM domain-containing protein [Gammaproteobacteria bacterium]